ncbi:MAG TPA: cellulase family glycosylhydrolase, partial [Candidatus Caenarcaniphilales bacterium]
MKITITRRQSRRTSFVAGAALLTLGMLASFFMPLVPASAQISEEPSFEELESEGPIPEGQSGGSFRVSGNKILAPNGSEFVIKGASINGPNWLWGEDMTRPEHLDRISNCWNFNLVRLNSNVLPGRGRRFFKDNNDIDKLVRAFTSRGIVTMFTAHDRIGSYYEGEDLERLKNFYRDLAAKYKDNPYVWFNIMNEPDEALRPKSDKWVSMHREVIEVIRDEVGANNMIMIDGAA